MKTSYLLRGISLVFFVSFFCSSWGNCPTQVQITAAITTWVDDVSADGRFVCTPGPCPKLAFDCSGNFPVAAGIYTIHKCDGGGKTYGVCQTQNAFTLGDNDCPLQP